MRARALRWALVLSLMVSTAAAAADEILGRWVLDEGAFREQAERFFGAAMLQVPAEQQEQAAAYADMAVDALVDQMRGSSVTFAEDGSVVMRTAAGAPQAGNWTREGDMVRLEPAIETPETASLTGELQADGTLLLRSDVPDSVAFVMQRADE